MHFINVWTLGRALAVARILTDAVFSGGTGAAAAMTLTPKCAPLARFFTPGSDSN